MSNTQSWFYIFLAALFEVAWTFSLKFLKFADLKLLKWSSVFKSNSAIFPLIGYILFGLGNIYFFSLALKKVPMSIAFGVWTATSIIILKFFELYFSKTKISFPELFFLLLITIGIVGLKYFSEK